MEDASNNANNGKKGLGFTLVTFRVICETLGHGEAVYLLPYDNPSGIRGFPLFTTAKSHPWYSFNAPISLAVSYSTNTSESSRLADGNNNDLSSVYKYRFAIHRGGKFHRFEQISDCPSESMDIDSTERKKNATISNIKTDQCHELRLGLLKAGGKYIISNVLGGIGLEPDIEKIRIKTNRFAPVSSMHSATGSASNSRTEISGGMKKSSSKKKVAFKSIQTPFNHHPETPRQSVNLDSSDGVIVASAFLPVHIRRSDDGVWSAEWDYEALLSMQTHLRVTRVGIVKWRGWHGNKGSDGSPEAGVPKNEREDVERCLLPFNCVPVWCEPSLFGEMYNGFCKGVLWPVLHNVTNVYSSVPEGSGSDGGGPLDSSKHSNSSELELDSMFSEDCFDDISFPIHGDGGREAELWSAYTEVNRQFVDTIVQCFNEGDLVWIHGFHLLILPSLLTRRIPMAKIGLFLHTPFPSSEIFRTLWCRDDLLRGMLNADQVGFHLFEYARHFLTSCRRLLGLNYGMVPDTYGGHNLAIECNGRHVTVTSIHAGISPTALNHILSRRTTIDQTLQIQNQFKNKIIFCAIDRLESLKGIPLKMLGLERFLMRCPQWVGKIVLIQVGISAFERGDDYVKTRREIGKIVGKINSVWPGTVEFEEYSEDKMRLQQRLALLRAADVCMVTSIQDGLNLIPLEFTHAHKDACTEQGSRDGRPRGICIMSEFSSATRVMRGALHINPWKVSEIANAFYQAVNMNSDERRRRVKTAAEYVTRVTTQRWALAVMIDLKGVHKNADVGRYAGAGLGLGFRLLGMDNKFDSLDTRIVAKAYRTSSSRLILLDYGGTILNDENIDQFSRYEVVKKTRDYTSPTERLLTALHDLCSDPLNHVFVVSGKERHSLMKTLHNIPRLGLAAEHGMFISWPNQSGRAKRKWETTKPDIDNSWRTVAISIMEVYTSRTHGSYIEETEMKVLWQYRDADPEFGYLQSRELEDHLSNVLGLYQVDVLHGSVDVSGGFAGYVEVRPKGVNKGVLSTLIMEKLEKYSKKRLDFVLAIGDDHCDEPMLSVVRQIGHRVKEARQTQDSPPIPPLPATITPVDVSTVDNFVSTSLDCFTCTVGKKPSAAKVYLNDVDDVHELLEALTRVAKREKFYSSVDLRNLTSNTNNANNMHSNKINSDKLLSSNYNAPISSGITRSISLCVVGNTSGGLLEQNEEVKVSSNLGQYFNTIQVDEEEDEPFSF